MNVGVRELKAKLSHFVSQAASGERVVVTDRGRPVAELVPIAQPSDLQRGIEEGWVEPPARTELNNPLLLEAMQSTASVLAEDRGD